MTWSLFRRARKSHTRKKPSLGKQLCLALLILTFAWVIYPALVYAFGQYAANIPNPNFSCNTCHGTGGPGSGTTNNPFKLDFASTNHVWNATLAGKDDDGDGFTNGEELQDPAGTFTAGGMNPGNSALVSNPSDIASFPPAPTMTAFMGVTANSNVSATINLNVALSTVMNGTPVGITRVDYIFKNAGTQNVVKTISSTSAAAYTAIIDTKGFANGAYDITATCFDKRSAGAGGPRTASLSINNVTVANPPVFTQQPMDFVVAPGGSAQFTVAASSVTSFKWQKNGSDVSNGGTISGATTATLMITGAVAADAGLYNCVATNAAGSTSSATAALIVGAQSSNSYVRLISLTPNGASANNASSVPPGINNTFSFGPTNRVISQDGRRIVFRSTSNDMITGINSNPNNRQNCWMRDLKDGVTKLVSTIPGATQLSGNNFSDTLLISGDGRFCVFNSNATDLTAFTPANNTTHVYRRDLDNDVTIPVGVKDGPVIDNTAYGTFNTNVQAVSLDGRFVLLFYDGNTPYDPSKAFNMGPNYYIRDCTSNTTTLVTVNSAGTGTRATGNTISGAVMTPDGRFIAFACDATDLGPVNGGGFLQVYLWDSNNKNKLELVSCTDGNDGTSAAATVANKNSGAPSISDDGRFITFETQATNLNINHTTGTNTVIYRRDRQQNKTEIVSQSANASTAGTGNATQSSISSNGQFVVFMSTDSDLVTATDNNAKTDIFRRDMSNSTNTKNVIVSSPNGQNAFGVNDSGNPRMSDDGRFVVFESNATNFVGAVDNNSKTDVFRRDCQTQSTILLSINKSLAGSSNGASQNPFTSANGLTSMFTSDGNDLVNNDVNGQTLDVFSATFNVAPTVVALQNASVTVGNPFTQNGSFSDPNGPDNFAGMVDYGDGTAPKPLILAANKTFALNNVYQKPGMYTVRVTVTDTANGVGMATAVVTVTAATASPGLTSSANPAGFGATINYTATVQGIAGLPAPTGVVTFNDNGVPIGNAPVVAANGANTASFGIASLAAGTHSITAVYSGDVNYSPATSAKLSQTINPSAPTITSPAAASLMINTPFTYTITSYGSQPITYTVTGLPAGFTFDTDTISGQVAVGGIITIKITATNVLGSSSQNLVITVTRPAEGDQAPAITSDPTANPNPATTADAITFNVAATDPDGDFVGFTWDFGDGTTGTGASPAHTYAAPGVYSVKVTASDSVLSADATLTVVVGKATTGGNPGATPFTFTKGTVKFNFAKQNQDSLSLSGTIPLGAGFNPANKEVQVIFAGYIRKFTIDAKGKSALKLSGKKNKDGSFKDASLKFTLSLSKSLIFPSCRDAGYFTDNTDKKGATITDIPAALLVDNVVFSAKLKAAYKAAEGKGGSGKLTP